MTAKQMFNAIGYTTVIETVNSITFKTKGLFKNSVRFNLNPCGMNVYYNSLPYCDDRLHEAINMKVKELGWYE